MLINKKNILFLKKNKSIKLKNKFLLSKNKVKIKLNYFNNFFSWKFFSEMFCSNNKTHIS